MTYRAVKILEITDNPCEVVGFLLKGIKTMNICIYRLPKSRNQTSFQEICHKIQITIDNFASQAQKVILCRDLIFRLYPGRYTSIESEKRQASDFLDMMDINKLSNISLVPTRLSNVKDILLINDEGNVSYRNTVINNNILDNNMIFLNIYMTKNIIYGSKVCPL